MTETVTSLLRAVLKLHRDMLKALAKTEAVVVSHSTNRGHLHLTLRLPSGTLRKVTAASSPSNDGIAITCLLQVVKRLIRADHDSTLKATP